MIFRAYDSHERKRKSRVSSARGRMSVNSKITHIDLTRVPRSDVLRIEKV